MNFGSGRILVIVGLVVVGVAILVNGFGHGTSTVGAATNVASASPSASTSPSSSASPTQSPLPTPQPPADVTVAVFNGTSALGLAAQAQATLTSAGYVAGQDPANSPVAGASKTVVYYRGGADADQNKADAQQVASTYFKGAKVALLGPDYDSLVKKSVQVAIVLGQDYATANGG